MVLSSANTSSQNAGPMLPVFFVVEPVGFRGTMSADF
jgi:hypothetical protein